MRLNAENSGDPLIPANFDFRKWLKDSGRKPGDFSNLEITDPKERGASAYGWHVLHSVTRPWAWTNATYVLSASTAAAAGIAIGISGHAPFVWWIVIATAALAIASVSIVRIPVGVLAAPLVFVACWSKLHDLRLAALAAVPVLAVTATYEVFRNMTLAGVEINVIDQIRAAVVIANKGLLLAVRTAAGNGSMQVVKRLTASKMHLPEDISPNLSESTSQPISRSGAAGEMDDAS
jgi:hypothetical protein